MTTGQQFGWALTVAVAILILLGPFVSQRDKTPAAQVVVESPITLSATPTIAELEVASQQALEETSQASTEEAIKIVEEVLEGAKKVLDGSKANFALAQFDAWLHGLETGKIKLLPRDLEIELNDLADYAREVGVAEKQIEERRERFNKLRFSNKA